MLFNLRLDLGNKIVKDWIFFLFYLLRPYNTVDQRVISILNHMFSSALSKKMSNRWPFPSLIFNSL